MFENLHSLHCEDLLLSEALISGGRMDRDTKAERSITAFPSKSLLSLAFGRFMVRGLKKAASSLSMAH